MQQVRLGFFKKIWVALAGETDPVKAQLKEMSKQGAGMARVANFFAILLVVLVSFVSLITLGNADFTAFLTEWQRHHLNLLAGAFALVIPIMVLAMDFGMLYAANIIRRLTSRHSDLREQSIHWAVLWFVVGLEAGTYIYAAALYEHPAGLGAWVFIVARACGAPLLSVYLSMAKAIPVSPRDILHQGELILGISILRSVTDMANNPEAKLQDKLSMYRSVSIASDGDMTRLNNLISIASRDDLPALGSAKPTPPSNGGQTINISPISDEIEESEETQYTQPDLRIARFTPDTSYHNGKKLRQHRNYNTMRQQVYELLDAVGLDEKGRPGLNAPQVARELRMKDVYAHQLRDQWWREQIASMRGTEVSLPDSLDEGEIDEASGIWVAR